jgi:hypothetical protein
MRTPAITLCALASSACVSPQSISSNLDSSLARYVGLPKQQIVAQFGAPKVQGTIGDRTVLAWSSRSQPYPPPIVTLRTTGAVFGEPIRAALVHDGSALNNVGCELRMVISADGEKVERASWWGSPSSCRSYLRTLEHGSVRAGVNS